MGPATQQDPIGIAGGLNLYGYANEDPINFSDPFGLVAWGLQRGGSRLSGETGSEETAIKDPCMRLRTGAQRAACRSRLDALTAEDWELSESAGLKCFSARAEFGAHIGLDLGLAYAYSGGLAHVGKGLLLTTEAGGISSKLILSATLRGPGSSGAAEWTAGRTLMTTGAAFAAPVALEPTPGISSLPRNAYDFWKGGGLSACRR